MVTKLIPSQGVEYSVGDGVGDGIGHNVGDGVGRRCHRDGVGDGVEYSGLKRGENNNSENN